MKPLLLPAYAKFNWFLKVGGPRCDGYHEVATLLQSIDLHDDLELMSRTDGEIRLAVEGLEVPAGEDNLVVRAARLLQEAVDGPGADLRLLKRIPVGAGLGGGSSDAAAALAGLNVLWEAGFSRESLAGLAAGLGSDVPFFLWGGTALGTGRGEKIECLEDRHAGLPLLLIFPGFGLATADVYRRYAQASGGELTSPEASTRIPTLLAAVRQGLWTRLSNDLEAAAFSLRPELKEIRDRVRAAGAAALLCGSGSTLAVVGGEGALAAVQRLGSQTSDLTMLKTRVLGRREASSRG